MNRISAFTTFAGANGQEIAYAYSVIDEDTGATIKDNQRKSVTVLPIKKNNDVLNAIETVNEYLLKCLEVSNG